MWEQDFEHGLLFATILMSINLVVGFVSTIVTQTPLTSVIAGSAGFLELGLCLMVGGCLMSRQPIEESARYTQDGELTPAWHRARIGRQILFAGVMLFVYVGILSILSLYIPF